MFAWPAHSDAVSQAVAWVLLAMSVASWVVILWKGWLLHRANADVARSVAAFWQAGNWADAALHLKAFDREALVHPIVLATELEASQSLGGQAHRAQQLTRTMRNALQGTVRKLQFGQILLATVGTTAPFIGLLGTVWGIHHALTAIAAAGQISIDQVAGPVGEALVMTAAGLAVAIPAVLAYNVYGRVIGQIEGELEGFAHDLLALHLQPGADTTTTAPSAGA